MFLSFRVNSPRVNCLSVFLFLNERSFFNFLQNVQSHIVIPAKLSFTDQFSIFFFLFFSFPSFFLLLVIQTLLCLMAPGLTVAKYCGPNQGFGIGVDIVLSLVIFSHPIAAFSLLKILKSLCLALCGSIFHVCIFEQHSVWPNFVDFWSLRHIC